MSIIQTNGITQAAKALSEIRPAIRSKIIKAFS